MAAVKGQPPKWKINAVEELKNIFTSHPVIAIVSFRDVSARQMQDIRREFKDKAIIKVTKNSLIERALDSVNGEFKKLKEFIGDQTAIVASNINPFKLYKLLEKTKVPSPLKPNQVSPVDVVVEKGPTPFPPGPIIGELQLAGLPAAIERGKIVIKDTVTVVKAGEVVKPEVARALEKLEIKPIKIGLDVKAIYDSGVILTTDVLAIDEEKIKQDFADAYAKALNLAINAAYITPETAEILLIKAFTDAKNLAINACIFEKDVMPDIITKAHSEMIALASVLPEEALDDELKGLTKLAEVKIVEEKVEEIEEEAKEEEEEEKKEEEAIEGLGALFG
ncbi:50S ribosomal protein L10 [Archaeoglobales archaeon]|nr:MAG: 50S ribosomal protein L10 [Archaeoglobales archaeon]